MAEQGGFEHVVGDRRAVDRHERLTAAVRVLVNVSREHFFTGAGFARDQYCRIAAGHACSQFQQLCAGRLNRHRPLAVSHPQTPQCMPGNQIQQRLGFKRFHQIVHCALTHGIHGALYSAMGRHQQHRQLRLACTQPAKQLMTVHAGHIDVTDHQAE